MDIGAHPAGYAASGGESNPERLKWAVNNQHSLNSGRFARWFQLPLEKLLGNWATTKESAAKSAEDAG